MHCDELKYKVELTYAGTVHSEKWKFFSNIKHYDRFQNLHDMAMSNKLMGGTQSKILPA